MKINAPVLKSKLDAALQLAALGFRVFPLAENTKLPLKDFDWLGGATTDPDVIRRWWIDPLTEWENDRNIGIRTGDGVAAIDVDNKNGKRGSDVLAVWAMLGDEMPPTLVNLTPTGGQHILVRVPDDVANGVDKLGDGLDVRGHHGYIVGPGSTIDGKPYAWQTEPEELRLYASDWPLALCPNWLFQKLTKATERPERAEQAAPLIELDSEASVARAIEYLGGVDHAVEGAAGDARTYQIAARLKDLGVSEVTALELMLEHWNEHCSPPWDIDTLELKVANAYRYGQNVAGNAAAEADFDAVEIAPRPGKTKPQSKLFAISYEDIKPQLDVLHLVEDVLEQEAMSVLYGESNSGKTFIMLDMALHVATGRPWWGKRVQQGRVIYVAAEAGRSIYNRVEAWRRKHKVGKAALSVVPCAVNLLEDGADTQPLIDLIRAEAAKYGDKVVWVIIDTLSRAMAGGNENASDDMGKLVRHLDKIRMATGAHLTVVHHSGKDKERGARGHSLLKAAADTELEISDKALKATKQRDMEMGKPLPFALRVVELGVDSWGKGRTSCVVDMVPEAVSDFQKVEPTPGEREVLGVLEDLVACRQAESEADTESSRWEEVVWVRRRDWRSAYFKFMDEKRRENSTKAPLKDASLYKNFQRAVDSLLEKGCLKINEQDQCTLDD